MVTLRQSCYDIKHPLLVSRNSLELSYELFKHVPALSVYVLNATHNQGNKLISNEDVSRRVWAWPSLKVLVGGTIHLLFSDC